MGRKASPESSRYYFTNDTEQAIIRYNSSTDERERNMIYDKHIMRAFDKLAENLIHRFKFYHFDIPYEDVKHETIVHLIEKINNYSEGKGKAFSYFSIVAKNYLINENNTNYDRFKNTADIVAVDESRNVINEVVRKRKVDDDREFMDIFIDYISDNIDYITVSRMRKTGEFVVGKLFERAVDIQVVHAILQLFRSRENIELYNKKALYVLIKEQVGSDNTQGITKIVKQIERLYRSMHKEWSETGRITITHLP
jgi:hypothetical protein